MKKWLRRTVASFVLLAVLALALAVGAGVLYFVPAWTASIPLIVLSGLTALAGVAWVGALLDARNLANPKACAVCLLGVRVCNPCG